MILGNDTQIRLSELATKIEDLVKHHLSQHLFWVVAEVSGHKFYGANARHYFELVEKVEGLHEPIAKFRGVAWSGGSENIRKFEETTLQKFTNGIQVLVQVRVEYHAVHGLTLVLQNIDHFYTLGNLERQRMEILQRLLRENSDAIQLIGDDYITRNKTLKLNAVIQKIAVIGSPNSEGFVDFMHTLEANQFGFKFAIDIYESSVQGQFAESELVQRFVDVYEAKVNYDAVVVIRGGGARTDFLVFDTYRLARAVARFPIPVITGIGHHKDVSITDLMAHISTKTPTKAAEFIIGQNRQFEDAVSGLRQHIIITTQQLLAHNTQKISQHKLGLVNATRLLLQKYRRHLEQGSNKLDAGVMAFVSTQRLHLQKLQLHLGAKPALQLKKQEMELRNLFAKIQTAGKYYLNGQLQNLAHFAKLIAVLHPDNVLKKGFAIVKKDGEIVTNVEDLKSGDAIAILTEKHEMDATITTIKER